MKKETFSNIVNEKISMLTLSSLGLACNLVSENYDNLPLLKHYPIDKVDLYYLKAQIRLLFDKNKNEEEVKFNIISRDKDIIKKIARIVTFDYFEKGSSSMIIKAYQKYEKKTKNKFSFEDTYPLISVLIKLM